MGRIGDGEDQPERATPFAEVARWVRAGALRLLSPTARDVLWGLVSHTNRKGQAWPRAEEIVEKTARGSTRHKRETIYRAFKEIESVGIYERSGRFQQPGYNVPGPIIFRLRPFNPQAAGRLQSLLDVPVRETSKRGDRRRFLKSVVPAPRSPVVPAGVPSVVPAQVVSDVPATGTQKGFKEQREEERVDGRGSVRGKSCGQAQAPASSLLVEAPKPSPGLSDPKDKNATKREKDPQTLLQFFMQLGEVKQPRSWYIKYFSRKGYDSGDVEWAWEEAERRKSVSESSTEAAAEATSNGGGTG